MKHVRIDLLLLSIPTEVVTFDQYVAGDDSARLVFGQWIFTSFENVSRAHEKMHDIFYLEGPSIMSILILNR